MIGFSGHLRPSELLNPRTVGATTKRGTPFDDLASMDRSCALSGLSTKWHTRRPSTLLQHEPASLSSVWYHTHCATAECHTMLWQDTKLPSSKPADAGAQTSHVRLVQPDCAAASSVGTGWQLVITTTAGARSSVGPSDKKRRTDK